jgi:hypothetical protein
MFDDMTAVARLTKDLKAGAATLGRSEARYLVDAYYAMQKDRISDNNQDGALEKLGEPHAVLGWLADQHSTLEKQVARALAAYADADPVGRWAQTIPGIGPIITAGLLAHIDIKQAPTVGHIWRFAGLDPSVVWNKGQKRPGNAKLNTLWWKIGESFVKLSGNDRDIYGKIYKERKEFEVARNDNGENAALAASILAAKKFRPETDARKHLEAGKLPPAQLHARAKRYAVKLFLSHLHHVWTIEATGAPPPKPYILTVEGGHAHFIAPPNYP